MTATIRCPSHNSIEICVILGFSSDGRLIVLDSCGYADDHGMCRYRGKIRRPAPQAGAGEHDRKEHKPRRGQVSLHEFIRRC